MEKYSDEELIEGLKSEDRKIIAYIYRRYLPLIKYILMKHGGDISSANDLFQEGLLQMLLRIKDKNFQLQGKFRSYFSGICYNIWKSQLRDQSIDRRYREKKLDDVQKYEDPQCFINEEQAYDETVFWEILDKLEKTCRTIIKLIFKELSLKDIADVVGLNYGYLRRKKCECIDDLSTRIQTHPKMKDYFS